MLPYCFNILSTIYHHFNLAILKERESQCMSNTNIEPVDATRVRVEQILEGLNQLEKDRANLRERLSRLEKRYSHEAMQRNLDDVDNSLYRGFKEASERP